MPFGALYYHPQRHSTAFANGVTVYHDEIGPFNQDPYVWSDMFLHTFCHITQIGNEVGYVNFWVSGDVFPNFNNLFCDLVFVIQEKRFWLDANNIEQNDLIVESERVYNDHYRHHFEHPFQRRRRYTLKAHPDRSYQPQDGNGNLIDILPFLNNIGLTTEYLRNMLQAGYASKPSRLNQEQTQILYNSIYNASQVRLTGAFIQNLL
jgi:hypothetical protein